MQSTNEKKTAKKRNISKVSSNHSEEEEEFVRRDGEPLLGSQTTASDSSQLPNPAAQTQTYTDSFFPRFITIKPKEGNFNHIDLFMLEKGVYAIVQSKDVHADKTRSGDILVEVTKGSHARSLLQAEQFCGMSVSIEPHKSLNHKKGVMKTRELKMLDVEDIKLELNKANPLIKVSEVYRIKTKDKDKSDGSMIDTGVYVLTFFGNKIPEKIKAGFKQLPVTPYTHKPMQCFICQKFGHSSKSCRATTPRCVRCSGEHSIRDKNACSPYVDRKCVNCEGQHSANSNECPVYKKEQEIVNIKENENVDFRKAKALYTQRHGNLTKTMASVVASQPAPRGAGNSRNKRTAPKTGNQSSNSGSSFTDIDILINKLIKIKETGGGRAELHALLSTIPTPSSTNSTPAASTPAANKSVKQTSASKQAANQSSPASQTATSPKSGAQTSSEKSVDRAPNPKGVSPSRPSKSGAQSSDKSVDRAPNPKCVSSSPTSSPSVSQPTKPVSPARAELKSNIQAKVREMKNARNGNSPTFNPGKVLANSRSRKNKLNRTNNLHGNTPLSELSQKGNANGSDADTEADKSTTDL